MQRWLLGSILCLCSTIAVSSGDRVLAAAGDGPPNYVIHEKATAGALDAGPRMDVVFLLDTTGSMSDEIEVVKQKMRDMVAEIASGDPAPQVRFGLVVYRDRGDAYVTSKTDLSDDIDTVVAAITAIVADGGGDEPESVNEALHVAVHEINWDPDENVDKTVFLIADAPPHLDYTGDYDYKQETRDALDRGIIIHAIGCSGLSDAGAGIFTEIAQGAEGTFEYLTYKREYATEDGRTATVLESGGRAFGVAGTAAAEPADWRVGADRLKEAGAAVEVAATPATTSAGGYGGGGMMGGGMGGVAAGPGTPAPEGAGMPGMAQVGDVENNLDTVLVGKLRHRAEAKGVVYATTGTLEPITRYAGDHSGIEDALSVVIRTADEWRKLWEEHTTAYGDPKPALPAVDFAKCMVIGVYAGQKPTGGYELRIVRTKATDAGVDLEWSLASPPPDMVVTQALTEPYVLIVVDRQEGDVTFRQVDPPAK